MLVAVQHQRANANAKAPTPKRTFTNLHCNGP